MPKIGVDRGGHIVDETEIYKILNACKDKNRVLFSVAVCWETGARISECLLLKKTDFTFYPNKIEVSLPTLKQRTKMFGSIPKRRIFIPRDEIVNRIIEPIVMAFKREDVPILNGARRDILSKELKRRYPDVYFHWLRHSRATIWSKDLKIYTLQYSMGWLDIRMANRYVHNEGMSLQMSKELGLD